MFRTPSDLANFARRISDHGIVYVINTRTGQLDTMTVGEYADGAFKGDFSSCLVTGNHERALGVSIRIAAAIMAKN